MTTFISYSRANSDFAVRLYRDLKDSGFDVWLDQIDIGKGSRWDDEVERALKECIAFLIILSPESIVSQNVKDEVGYAIDAAKQILPVLLKPCDIPLRLRRFQFVDFASKPYEESLVEIKSLLSMNQELIASIHDEENSPQAGTQISTVRVSNQEMTAGDPKIKAASKTAAARPPRKLDLQVIIALIGLMGTIIAALLSSPLFARWFGSEPANAATTIGTIDGTSVSTTPMMGATLYPALGDVVYDFSDHICEASWFSAAGALPCPGTDGDENGFVLKVSIPQQESGEDYRTGILTVPQNTSNGYIQGFFKPLLVQDGDHFRTTISCEKGSLTCYVAFRLDYQIGADPIRIFWFPYAEKYDEKSHDIDIDLSPLAGNNVKFILSILSGGPPINDRALWIAPRITRPCKNEVVFVADVSVPSGTVFSPNEKFTRTIRLKNTGTCTWTTDYSLNFVSGDDMNSPASIKLPANVVPSQIVDIAINLQAPFRAGSYRGYWKLNDPRTGLFGDGSQSDEAFEVDIRVADTSTTTP